MAAAASGKSEEWLHFVADDASHEPESDWICGICCELAVEPTTLPCGHTFDKHCLVSSINSDNISSDLCPLCRARLPSEAESYYNINTSFRNLAEKYHPERYKIRSKAIEKNKLEYITVGVFGPRAPVRWRSVMPIVNIQVKSTDLVEKARRVEIKFMKYKYNIKSISPQMIKLYVRRSRIMDSTTFIESHYLKLQRQIIDLGLTLKEGNSLFILYTAAI